MEALIPKPTRALGRWIRLTLILGLLLTLAPTAVFAEGDDPAGPIPTGDDNTLEVGIWWAEDYPPEGSGGSDLPATRPDALGLRNLLRSTCRVRFLGICIAGWPTPTWFPRFVYGNKSAWESDWTTNENNYVDRVDLAYFAGHGWSGGIVMGVGGRDHNDPYVRYSDVQNKWGNRDLDWIGFAACNVLEDSHRRDWARTMRGLRLMMGFVTTMADVPHGEKFGKYIRLNHTMTQAWFRAADDLQPQNKIARVLAEEQWMFNDRWNAHNAQDYYDNTYWWITHHVGSEPARWVDAGQIEAMPVFQVQPLSLDEAESRWTTLAQTVGITPTAYITETTAVASFGRGITQEGGAIRVSEDGQLIMDERNGLVNYTNLNDLWNISGQPESAAADQMLAISQDHARQIADQFLQQTGLAADDAQFFEVAADTLAQAPYEPGIQGAGILQEETLVHQVIYSRILTATLPATARRPAQTVAFSVMGPGSKLKVYVAPQVSTVAARSPQALLQEAVDGAVAGYRRVQQPASRTTGALLMVPVLPWSKVSTMVTYVNPESKQPELENMFGLSAVPLPDITERSVLTHTLAYWEGPMGWSQDQLIPVHTAQVRNVLQDGTVVTSTAYIPVNTAFMPPLAKIESAQTADGKPIPARVMWDDQLVFTAADASKTLAENGYPAELDFTPGSGDVSYTWYLDEVSEETKLGSGRTLNYTVGAPGQQPKAGISVQTIILEVRDLSTNRQPDRSYTRYQLTVVPPIFLPYTSR